MTNTTKYLSLAAITGSSVRLAVLIAFVLASGALSLLQTTDASAADAHSVPTVDGAIGPCSVELTVNDAAGAPLYDAKVRVHIAYGFMRAHKLDLEVGTNVDGKARFTGLPQKVKESLYFKATQGDRMGEFVYDPAQECTSKHTIVVAKDENNSNPPK